MKIEYGLSTHFQNKEAMSKKLGGFLFVLFLLILTGFSVSPLEGTYSAEKQVRPDDRISLQIILGKTEGRYTLVGSGGYHSGRPVAPDFDGYLWKSGHESWIYTFEDSFGNKGRAKIIRAGKDLIFEATISDLKEPRCFMGLLS
jgi:hypothetical protein